MHLESLTPSSKQSHRPKTYEKNNIKIHKNVSIFIAD